MCCVLRCVQLVGVVLAERGRGEQRLAFGPAGSSSSSSSSPAGRRTTRRTHGKQQGRQAGPPLRRLPAPLPPRWAEWSGVGWLAWLRLGLRLRQGQLLSSAPRHAAEPTTTERPHEGRGEGGEGKRRRGGQGSRKGRSVVSAHSAMQWARKAEWGARRPAEREGGWWLAGWLIHRMPCVLPLKRRAVSAVSSPPPPFAGACALDPPTSVCAFPRRLFPLAGWLAWRGARRVEVAFSFVQD
jgi:hypothetical protein